MVLFADVLVKKDYKHQIKIIKMSKGKVCYHGDAGFFLTVWSDFVSLLEGYFCKLFVFLFHMEAKLHKVSVTVGVMLFLTPESASSLSPSSY